jgi:hypothetical protein
MHSPYLPLASGMAEQRATPEAPGWSESGKTDQSPSERRLPRLQASVQYTLEKQWYLSSRASRGTLYVVKDAGMMARLLGLDHHRCSFGEAARATLTGSFIHNRVGEPLDHPNHLLAIHLDRRCQ